MTAAVSVSFSDYDTSVFEALDHIHAGRLFAGQDKIIIKPNLVTDSPFPVTTSPRFCGAIIDYIRSHSEAAIVIAEGVGDPASETMEIFHTLGYTRLAEEKGTELADLNTAPLIRLENPDCKKFPEFYIPEMAMDHFIVSAPVLKAHSLSIYTGTLKNMVGFAPPEHYAGSGGIWNKAEFHIDIQQAIIDLNRYRSPDLSIIDASVGLAEYHLGGPACDPPVDRMVAGCDPVAVDRMAAGLLGLDWRKIGHLSENML